MMNLTMYNEKKPWGVTSLRIQHRILQEVLPPYNNPGPFGLAPLEPVMSAVFQQVETICREEEERARNGFTINSSFRVDYDPQLRSVIVTHVLNTNDDEVFFILLKNC